ncbi:hypothetical protein BpHYR1_022498 [Brachionus plicatilis]|uniref:Uncharacterized protein n=1 Tax=Brachionus plicatilis TaxID=10195 RepID=A0A3M7R402_BRAPC|nr:hypothetical protein BpHYR1_022498 [Brachionus plicatilis]
MESQNHQLASKAYSNVRENLDLNSRMNTIITQFYFHILCLTKTIANDFKIESLITLVYENKLRQGKELWDLVPNSYLKGKIMRNDLMCKIF